MSIAKRLEARGDNSEKDKLLKLASETGVEEFELDLSTGLIDSWVRKIDVLENESLTDYINRIKAAEKKGSN